MAKKTLILTNEQIDEICGEDFGFTYLNSTLTNGDSSGYEYVTNISAEGNGPDDEYTEPITTKDFADMQSKDWPRDSRAGRSAVWRYVGECSKKEFEDGVLNEEKAHGNKRLNNRKFGDSNVQYGTQALTQKAYRERQATERLVNAKTDDERQKAAKSLEKMANNGGESYRLAQQQFNSAKKLDKQIQQSKPEGTKINVTNREHGNGKGHSNNNIFIVDVD